MRRQRIRSFVPALTVLAAGALLIHTLAAITVSTGIAKGEAIGDWVAFYTAARIVARGDATSLYDPETQAGVQHALFGPGEPFAYAQPAFVALALSPLGHLPFATSFWVWLAVNVAIGLLLLRIAWDATADWSRADRVVSLGLAAVSTPVMLSLLNGQLDLIALVGLVGCYALHNRGHHLGAGAALALALAKPQLVVGVALLLLVRRAWKTLAAFLVAGATLLLAPAAFLGLGIIADEMRLLTSVAGASHHFRVNAGMMANVRGAVVSLTGSGSVFLWGPPFAIVALTALVVALTSWRRRETEPEGAWALAFLLPLLVSPHVHIQSLVLLLPAALLYMDARSRATQPVGRQWVIASYPALTLLWVATVAGFAALFLAPLAAFTLAARGWPARREAQERVALPLAA